MTLVYVYRVDGTMMTPIEGRLVCQHDLYMARPNSEADQNRCLQQHRLENMEVSAQ